jgi:peptidoglycan-associated lipoprotein
VALSSSRRSMGTCEGATLRKHSRSVGLWISLLLAGLFGGCHIGQELRPQALSPPASAPVPAPAPPQPTSTPPEVPRQAPAAEPATRLREAQQFSGDAQTANAPVPDVVKPVGLPDSGVPQAIEDPSPPEFRMIYFRFGRADIEPRNRPTVAHDAEILRRHPGLDIAIEGHCDDRGTEQYNLALGLRRAEAVEQALEEAGIQSGQLQIVSFGKDEPLELGHSRSARAVNRSVVIRER